MPDQPRLLLLQLGLLISGQSLQPLGEPINVIAQFARIGETCRG